MELPNPFSIYFLTFLFLFILTKLAKKICSNTTTKLPPGPKTLPLIGNTHQILGSMPHHCFRNLANKYGPLMHLKLGDVSNIIVTSPEIAKQIMKTHDLNFSNRSNLVLSNIISYNGTDIAFAPYGHYWRLLRKICTVELLTVKRVQSFRSIREEEVLELVKTIGASEGSIVNLSGRIFLVTYGIVARAAFGKRSRYQKIFIAAVEEQLKLLGGFSVADLYPNSKVVQMMSRTKAKLKKVHAQIDGILQDILDEHRNRKRKGEVEDLVDVLLKFQQDKDSEYPLTEDNIKAVILDIFAGGGETSSSIVEWAMSEMIKNPKLMEEAQDEIRSVFDRQGYVDETKLHQLTFLKSIVKETLRLHPSVPFLLPRQNREKCQINGYELPENTRIVINAWAIARDPNYWAEPETFKPERYLNSSIDFRGTDFEFIPFGAGRRMCPGIVFAMPNMELPLAQLLYHFDWKLPNGMKNEELDMSESFRFTLRRKNELCLSPITRRPIPQ
ncbi:hypothetical protein RJT34_10814 [Clitoria ternatea]|uniref:Cytochrome P450 n=1 Tax=Clitoria ternatea TaxID=43366 RepID=A0AAN9JLJ2_CLITE